MQGNVVVAARWLGASMVLSGAILAVAFNRASPPAPVATADPVAPRPAVAFRPTRVAELPDQSEGLRRAGDDWDRTWFLDNPAQMTPFRTHGNLGP